MIAHVTDWADSIGAVRMRSPLSSRSRPKVLTAPMLSTGERLSRASLSLEDHRSDP
jgi:hypothetical protein